MFSLFLTRGCKYFVICREKVFYPQIGMEKEEVRLYFAALGVVTLLLCLWLLMKRFCMDRFVDDFQDKYVLITGCDSGFGRETTLRLDSLGLNVFATCLTSEGLENLTAMCSKRLQAFHLDVTDSKEIRNAYKLVAHSLPENTGI